MKMKKWRLMTPKSFLDDREQNGGRAARLVRYPLLPGLQLVHAFTEVRPI